MPYYQVDYFYLAIGMDGIPDKADYGIWQADTATKAKRLAVDSRDSKSDEATKRWIIGCLSAREILSPQELV